MRKVPTILLKPGMKVAKTVFSSDGFTLLAAGVILKERYIEQLNSFGVAAIYVEDDLLPDIEVDDIISEKTRVEAIKVFKEALNDIQRLANSRKSLVVGGEKLASTVQGIAKELLGSKNLMVNLADIRTMDSYTYGHSVNVCVLSILTGIALNMSQNQLVHLGMGALMHDVGKALIPKEILNKPGPLSAEEYKAIQRHSEHGFGILSKQQDISSLAAKVAMEHHEKYDGTGYPRGLRGDEIHLFSRIVSIADVYDALTADHTYRNGYLPHEAYELLAGGGGGMFDYELVKVFLKHIAAYPVGTLVKLNSGEIGIVIDTPKGLSTRPVVRILYKDGVMLEVPYEVKLAESMRLVVSQVITDEEFNKLKIAG